MRIAVLGAGAWGTALAIHAGQGHAVTLWARDAAQAQAMQRDRVNARYLPDQPFSAGIGVQSGAFSPDLLAQDSHVCVPEQDGVITRQS